jgi:hypothetical protein
MRAVLPITFWTLIRRRYASFTSAVAFEAVTGTLASHEALRDSMEFLLHQRNQTRQRRFVATALRQKQACEVGKRSSNVRILRRFFAGSGF